MDVLQDYDINEIPGYTILGIVVAGVIYRLIQAVFFRE